MEKKKKIILSIILIAVIGSLSFYVWQNYQKHKTEAKYPKQQIVYESSIEEKIKTALDPKTCGQYEQVNVIGYISEKGMDFIKVESGKNTPAQTLKFDKDTLFIEAPADDQGRELSKKIISFNEVAKMQNVSIVAFKRDPEKNVVARIVKIIK